MKPVAFLSELMVQILCALNFLGVMWGMWTVDVFVYVDGISYIIRMNVSNIHTKFNIHGYRIH